MRSAALFHSRALHCTGHETLYATWNATWVCHKDFLLFENFVTGANQSGSHYLLTHSLLKDCAKAPPAKEILFAETVACHIHLHPCQCVGTIHILNGLGIDSDLAPSAIGVFKIGISVYSRNSSSIGILRMQTAPSSRINSNSNRHQNVSPSTTTKLKDASNVFSAAPWSCKVKT